MNADVSTDIVISRPLEIVAGYASDPDHVPDWYANNKSVEWRSQKPLIVGSERVSKRTELYAVSEPLDCDGNVIREAQNLEKHRGLRQHTE